jgi:hypothetical protein
MYLTLIEHGENGQMRHSELNDKLFAQDIQAE